ncbi:LAMI_0C02058g1_1 [Lachancea mirantina]|uniref:LAMI_0C02058g1_1 n=1 Tax=Lachancea mirantina TaxID=1230905 RepID=A0A1G4J0K9_9SACH|nr:LAMI_0C02058g1_1 [Lachancea mirantina]
MEALFERGSWLLLKSGAQVLLYRNLELFTRWDDAETVEFRCQVSSDELQVYGSRGRRIESRRVNLAAPGQVSKCEKVLEVWFEVSRYEILWEPGWVLCSDSAAGCLHVFDVVFGRYVGYVRFYAFHERVVLVDTHEFMVVASKFDQDVMTASATLNVYKIHENRNLALSLSVSLGEELATHKIVRDSRFAHFGVVSVHEILRTTKIRLYLPKVAEPFYEADVGAIGAYRTCFADEITIVFAGTDPVTDTMMLVAHDVASSRAVSRVAPPTQIAAPTRVTYLSASSTKTICFALSSDPNLVYVWDLQTGVSTCTQPSPVIALPHDYSDTKSTASGFYVCPDRLSTLSVRFRDLNQLLQAS